MTRFVVLLGIIGSSAAVLAQSLPKSADDRFVQVAHAKAAGAHDRALTDPALLSDNERRAAKAWLAYRCQQNRDTKSAERLYRELIEECGPSGDYGSYYLHYAQALASNGKYDEAQVAFNQHNALQPTKRGLGTPGAEPNGSILVNPARTVTAPARPTGKYTLEFLNLNTRRPEFSPMLYKDGLVFVSAGSKRVGDPLGGRRTPFLDLFYLPKGDVLLSTNASERRVARLQSASMLGRDEYTASTANDSRTVGRAISMNMSERPVSESERFSRTINSKYHEGPATFSKDGSRVIFTRNSYTDGQYRDSRDGVNKLKLYTATQTDGYWSKADELPFNSDDFSTGHPSLASGRNGEPDQLLYFSSDRPGGFGGTDIYVSTWTNGAWGTPVNLGKAVNSERNELFPFVDERGNLYVASNGHGGLGGLDIFYVPLTGAGQPAGVLTNLGEPLNSPHDDFGIVTDGQRSRGYFSSNRKHGKADDDLYRFARDASANPCRELTVSVFDADTQQPLVNTSIAVDNPSNEEPDRFRTDVSGSVRICMTADSDTRLVASRDGYVANKVGFSVGQSADTQASHLNIGLTKSPTESKPDATMLRGRVLAQATRKPIAGVVVTVVNECDGITQQTTTDSDGRYVFTLLPGCGYRLEAMIGKMGTAGSRIAPDGSGTTDVLMFKKGDVITIDNIHYDLDKATIRPDAAAELDKVAVLLRKYPAMTVEMRSHTDSRATDQYNVTLSANRAKSAVAYLQSKGIAARRVVARGYGEMAPLNKCKDNVDCPETEHQKNRRTEIKILTLE